MNNGNTAMNEPLSNKKILVLGGNGFIGSHLIDALLEKGYSVRLFDRPNTLFLGSNPVSNVELMHGDLNSDADIASAVVDCDICFHLISTVVPASSNLDPVFDIETNLAGTVKLLNHAVKAGLKKIIFLSSGGTVYGIPRQLPIDENHPTNPLCSYGITKLAIEKYLHLYQQLYGLDYTILRLANPFGERQRIHATQGAIAVFLGKALRKETVEVWGDGSVVRDYIHISDVVCAMLKSMTYKGSEHLFNIGSGRGVSLNEVLDGIEMVTEEKVIRHYAPERKFDVPVSVLAIDRAMNALNWEPKTPFIDGLRKMVRWLDMSA